MIGVGVEEGVDCGTVESCVTGGVCGKSAISSQSGVIDRVDSGYDERTGMGLDSEKAKNAGGYVVRKG